MSTDDTAIVMGVSMARMPAARVLADFCDRVTQVPCGKGRRGVPARAQSERVSTRAPRLRGRSGWRPPIGRRSHAGT